MLTLKYMRKIKYLFLLFLLAAPVCAQEEHNLGFMDFGAHIQAGAYPNSHGARGAEGNGDIGFMTNPDFNVNQAWVWLGREADASTDAFDFGFRLDAFYGTDAFLQAAINSNYMRPDGSVKKYWDSNFMRGGRMTPGVYGFAVPQTYAEIAYYKWKLSAGRLYFPLGYENADATLNYFYSKTFYTMSLPPTVTGALLAKSFGPLDLTAGAYYGLGTGFYNPYRDYFFSGAAVYNFGKNAALTYYIVGGRYGNNINGGARIFAPAGAFVYYHNLLFEFTPKKYLHLATEIYYNHDNLRGMPANNLYGVTQYAVYDINKQFSAGLRAEYMAYYRPQNDNRYSATANITYKPVKWFYARPEVRYSWGNAYAYNGGKDAAQLNGGMEFTAIF